MLWYKAWLESRWRFLIGFALLMVVACGAVFEYPAVQKLLPLVGTIDTSSPGMIRRLINEGLELQRTYRGFVWFQFFRQNLTQMGTLFAVLLGSGGLIAGSSGGPAIFTLSLPVSRSRLVSVRAATGLAEFFVLAVIPSLVIPMLSPAIGQRYSVADAAVHGLCAFVAGAVFFSLAIFLSTLFSDLWRPLLIACAAAVLLAIGEQAVRDVAPVGLFRVMSGERYFRTGQLPWAGLFVSAAAAGALLYGAAINMTRRDF